MDGWNTMGCCFQGKSVCRLSENAEKLGYSIYKGMVAVREENKRESLPNNGGLSLRGLLAPYCEEVA